ncbi:uncharacterized protein LOC108165562 [Drosophila miranda]|uniref:uncharacterized protein LOC108165562 n=1 Tax=Drosophila miranda TaxID=7229 RepID=UPI0007E7128B|nr:uncharacterized protein LOC108165562 [Drosophila miranda]
MSSNENKEPVKAKHEADQQNPEGSRNPNMQSNAEKENPLQGYDIALLAPIEREYFMRINRKEQSTSVKQPENWRARPPLSPAEPSRNRSGTYGARGSASGAEDHLLDDDELFSNSFESGPVYQEQPDYALVLTWSSYLKERHATICGVCTPLGMYPAESRPPIENWRDRPAPQSAIDAGAAPGSSWRRHLDHNNDRLQSNSRNYNQGNSNQGHRGTPAAEPSRGSQGQQTRVRSEFQGHQQWDREREPRQNHGPHGHRNQWTNSGFYDPPTRNDGRNYHGRNQNQNQNQAPGNRGNPNGLNGATGGQAAHRRGEAFRGLSSISGFQRSPSFGSSFNDRPPPGNGATPGRRASS